MSDKFSAKNQSLRAKAKDVATRLEDAEARLEQLERALAQVMKGTDSRLNNTAAAINGLSDVVTAITDHVGRGVIEGIVEEKQRERDQEQADKERNALEEAINDGYVTATDVIGDNSLIVGQEMLPNGKYLGVGYQQVAFSNLDEKYKEMLRGKGVGEVVQTPTGGKFTVTEVYNVDAEKGRIVLEEKAKKQTEAAVAAAGETAQADEAQL